MTIPLAPGLALGLSLLLLAGGCTPAEPTSPPGGSGGVQPSGAAATAPADGLLRLVVDTDMAADDIVALASLLRDPAVDLMAITVVGTGEAHCPQGMFVARSMVTMLRDDPVPVACGRRSPMGDAQPFPDAWRAGVDAGNGLALVSPSYAPESRDAEQVLVDLAAAEAAEGRMLTILTLGTLTNLAGAAALDPGIVERVRVVAMLGAVGVAGNVIPEVAGGDGPPVAEWNAHADPTAVRMVLEAGYDLTLVPLDATRDVPASEALFRDLEADHAAGPADLVFELWARNPFMRGGGYYHWDPLAAIAVRHASVVTVRDARLTVVEGAGLDGGRLVEVPDGHPVTIATAADRGRFEALVLDRLRIGPPRANAFTPVGSVRIAGGPNRCDVALDPPAPPEGLLAIEVRSSGTEPVGVVVFEVGPLTWDDVESFVAGYRPDASPPPVLVVSQLQADPGAMAAGYGRSPSGSLGVACFTGDATAPRITLAGPFPIGG